MEEQVLSTGVALADILTSEVYARCVKYLMRTTRTPEAFQKWVNGFANMPRTVGARMGLSPETVQQLVDEITEEHNHTDTMQVPCGEFSILSALEAGDVKAPEALLYLALNHGSSWNTGRTWVLPQRALAESLGISKTYADKIIHRLEKRWVSPLKTPRGHRYQLMHHDCNPEEVPLDRDGKPQKFAVPHGESGPFERLFAGDISWKACLVGIVLKLNSDWKTGQTHPCTMLTLAKRCRFAPNTLVKLIQELIDAGMLKRLSKPHETSVFQLYPKPYREPEDTETPKPAQTPQVPKRYDVPTTETFRYSENWQYRQHRETLVIERRRGRGKWTEISDYERAQVMPKAILRDFKMAAEANAAILRRFGRK